MKKLTVAEYAELKGISKVAAYKRIEKGRVKAVSEVYNGREQYIIILGEDKEPIEPEIKPDLTEDLTKSKPDLTSNKPDLTDDKPEIKPDLTEDLTDDKPDLTSQNQDDKTDILDLLKSQIQEKDKQIERLQNAVDEKDKQLKEQFDRLTALIARSQELEALSHKLLGEGETDEPEPLQDNSIVVNEKPDNEEPEPPKKQGFFSRLFKRKKGE